MESLPHKIEKLTHRMNGSVRNQKIKTSLLELVKEGQKLEDELMLRERYLEVLKQDLHVKQQFGFIFSKNETMQRMFQLAEKYKESDHPLLILGEKGSGKEAFARAIHLKSTKRGPFIVFEPGMKGTDLEDNLEASLYFQDVTLTQPQIQTALLEALRCPSKAYRVIVSTTRFSNLEPEVHAKLKSMVLEVLPLRSRKEDILHLVDVFVREFSKNEKNIQNVSPSALNKLLEYSWPKNTSELKLEIKRMVMDFPQIKMYSLQHLSEKIVGSSIKELSHIIETCDTLTDATQSLERKMVFEALIKHNWNKSKVSRELGISRSGLIQKVNKYKIQPSYPFTFSETNRRII